MRALTPRRTLATAVTLAAVLVTAGCGGDQGSTGADGTADDTSAAQEGDGSTAAAGDGEAVEIAYLHRLPDGEGMTKVDEIVDRWNAEHPDIQVTATKFDGAAQEMMQKLETDVRAENAPCLAQLGYAEIPSAFTKGLVEDVTAEAEKYKANYSEGTYDLMTVGGAVVGLPQDTGPLVYYYNKAAFDDLGLDVPTTGEELVDVATKAAAEGKYVAAFTPDEAPYWLSGQAAAAGATWFGVENDAWAVDVESDATATVAALWQDLLDADAVVTHPRWDDSFTKSLVDQELIGHIGAAWEAPLLVDSMQGSGNDGQWAVAQLPQLGDAPASGPDGGSGVAVMKGCEHPAEAMEFNDWFNTQVDDLVSQGLVVATTVEPMTTPDAVAEFYGGQDVFAELSTANEMTNPFPYMPTWPAVMDPMVTAAAAAADGSGKVADVFSAAQEASVSSLKDAGLPVAE